MALETRPINGMLQFKSSEVERPLQRCGVEIWRGGFLLRCDHRHLTVAHNHMTSVDNSPRVTLDYNVNQSKGN
ncbi:hypothetical protein TNCV_381111 [Trichonephila clavipes]|uniref:Uncharacterized protein n=1 Tax=Trichonephila clavipes TaxID=2585209 RepID=A0A8X6SCB5_TRICX|nr:hypothetical protein TNCV_381111 [Trichonephila clavipes]